MQVWGRNEDMKNTMAPGMLPPITSPKNELRPIELGEMSYRVKVLAKQDS